jgi:hypothetical protein
MKDLLRPAALLLTLSICVYSCSSNNSKQTVDTAFNTVKNSTGAKADTSMQNATSVTTTKTETSITIDPATGDSTIITKTVIKHKKRSVFIEIGK